MMPTMSEGWIAGSNFITEPCQICGQERVPLVIAYLDEEPDGGYLASTTCRVCGESKLIGIPEEVARVVYANHCPTVWDMEAEIATFRTLLSILPTAT